MNPRLSILDRFETERGVDVGFKVCFKGAFDDRRARRDRPSAGDRARARATRARDARARRSSNDAVDEDEDDGCDDGERADDARGDGDGGARATKRRMGDG